MGYQITGSAAMLAYIFLLQSVFAGLFLKSYLLPNTAQQTAHQASNLRMMSKRNFVAAVVSLLLTAVNFGTMIVSQGYQRGLVSMSLNTLDISIVACIIHWVTTHPSELQFTEKALQRGNGDKPVKLEIKQHQEVVVLTELNTQA
ncbi:hypothetical protein DFQ28_006593 [Apophysomyces sp. BC1034]|nr:hypothetical protein DFQ29_003290 [Apophysomyces sp. BC1021]KAG0194744.1 hypothetical protein DFQ28_006593 [Apophysomyces sp. BC1034]